MIPYTSTKPWHLRAKEKEVGSLFEAQKLQNLKSERSLQDIRKEMQANTDRLAEIILGF